MVKIAIAGGASPRLGRSIVTSILQTSNTPIILSRQSANQDPPRTKYGAEIRYVDYNDQNSLVQALKDVHTVISVLLILGPEFPEIQMRLLHAAEEAGCKRFAPSEWELGPEADGRIDVIVNKIPVREACAKSSLECARFSQGMFMNYLGIGWPYKSPESKVDMLGGLDEPPVIWDLEKGVAELPVKADGSMPRITMTSIDDVGRFVAAACELPNGRWGKNMTMVGETVGVERVTELIGEILGRKLEVRKVGEKELKRRIEEVQGIGNNEEEMFLKMNSQIELLMLEDERPGKCILEPVVNRLCPHVKPTTVEEYLKEMVSRKAD